LYKPLVKAVPHTEEMSNFGNFKKILTVDFVVCILAVKKKIRAGFDMSDWTIPLLYDITSQMLHAQSDTDDDHRNEQQLLH
jgi:hypothetical protein